MLEVLGYAETRLTPVKEEEEGEEEVKEEVKEEGERRRRSKRRRKTSTDKSTTPSSSSSSSSTSASPPYYHVVIKYDNDHSSEDIPLHFFLLRVVSPLSGAWIEQPQVRVNLFTVLFQV